jgi:hypothetical protein
MKAHPLAGIYRHLHAGTHDQAALTFEYEPNVNELTLENTGNETVHGENESVPLFALTGFIGTEPVSINEALKSSDAEAWNTALEYEISHCKAIHLGDSRSISQKTNQQSPALPSCCKGTSICFLTSPILSYSPPVHMYSPSSLLYYSQGL